MCWTHWQFSINNIPAEQLVGLLGFGRMLATLPTYVHPPQWCTEDPVHGERKYIASRRYRSIFKKKCIWTQVSILTQGLWPISDVQMCSKVLLSSYRCKRCSSWGRGGERWATVGRAILISFPSSLSLMKSIAPISFSAFLSIRVQKLFTSRVWPSQFETKDMAGAERPLLLCLCHQRLRQGEEFSPVLSSYHCKVSSSMSVSALGPPLLPNLTLQKPSEKKHRTLAVSFCLSEMQLLPSLACSMESAGVWIRPFPSKTAGMLMFKIK